MGDDRHRFLDSDVPAPEGPQFEALGHAGSDHYLGLETFDNPGCLQVTYTSDEVVAFCPITKQPDHYTCSITLMFREDDERCIESKSLKLWLRQFNNEDNGLFCESLAVFIRVQVSEVTGIPEDRVVVQLDQKSRGGITIRSVA